MIRLQVALLTGLATLAAIPTWAQAPLKVLRVVPQADVVVTDPLFTST